MAQYLETVLEDLKRFSPNARVEPPVIIDGISPSSAVNITMDDGDKVKELTDQVDRHETTISSLEGDVDEMKSALKEIKSAIAERGTDYAHAVADIAKILDEGGY